MMIVGALRPFRMWKAMASGLVPRGGPGEGVRASSDILCIIDPKMSIADIGMNRVRFPSMKFRRVIV